MEIRDKYKQALINKKQLELLTSLGPHGHFASSFCYANAMAKIEAEAEFETIEMEWKLKAKEEL